MRMRLAAVATSLALLGTACGGRQLTNRQLATGAVAAGAVVGMIVLYSLAGNCEYRNGGTCGDPDEPPPWPR